MVYWRKGYAAVLGIKSWSDELFDGYMLEKSIWSFDRLKKVLEGL